MIRYWTTVLLLTGALGGYAISMRRTPDTLAAPLETVQSQIDGWTQTGTQTLEGGVLRHLLPTSYMSRIYSRSGANLGLFVAYYAQQRAGESMHSPKNCLPGSGWEIWKYDSAEIFLDGVPTKINKYFIENAGQRMLVFYWYQSKKRIIASEYLGKVLLIRDTLLDGHTGGSMVRIIVPDAPGMSQAATSFAKALVPQIQFCLGKS